MNRKHVNTLILSAAHGIPVSHVNYGPHSVYAGTREHWETKPHITNTDARATLQADSEARGIDILSYARWYADIYTALTWWPHDELPDIRLILRKLLALHPEEHWGWMGASAFTYGTVIPESYHPLSILMTGFNWAYCEDTSLDVNEAYFHFEGYKLLEKNNGLGTGGEYWNLKRAMQGGYCPAYARLPVWVVTS